MFFWLFVIILVISIALIVIANSEWVTDNNDFVNDNDDAIVMIGLIALGVSGILIICMVAMLFYQYINADAVSEKNKETYRAIEYKVASDACRDEFGLLSKSVIDEVQAWNEYVRYYQSMQDNFWFGIFYPDIYDQLETIDYDGYVSK